MSTLSLKASVGFETRFDYAGFPCTTASFFADIIRRRWQFQNDRFNGYKCDVRRDIVDHYETIE
jgi:hypothetical protein